jgi:hypothetical protein
VFFITPIWLVTGLNWLNKEIFFSVLVCTVTGLKGLKTEIFFKPLVWAPMGLKGLEREMLLMLLVWLLTFNGLKEFIREIFFKPAWLVMALGLKGLKLEMFFKPLFNVEAVICWLAKKLLKTCLFGIAKTGDCILVEFMVTGRKAELLNCEKTL